MEYFLTFDTLTASAFADSDGGVFLGVAEC